MIGGLFEASNIFHLDSQALIFFFFFYFFLSHRPVRYDYSRP